MGGAHGLQQIEFFFFPFIFISWMAINLQYCSGVCHTLTWISHGFTCIPHPDPPSHLAVYPIPLGLPSAPGPRTCLMHPTWLMICFTLDNIHISKLFSQNIPPSPSPTESKSLFCTSVSLFMFCIDSYVYMYIYIYIFKNIDIYVSMTLGIYISMYLECVFLCI